MSFLLFCSLAGQPGQPVAAQSASPAVNIRSEQLCTERPPSLYGFHAEVSEISEFAQPLRFEWDLGDGARWYGAEVPEHAYDFGRYNVILAVTDADGRARRASLSLNVEAKGCGGI
ncbi:MAG: PKD domain-containing protein [Betaproteobacteria bacterium]|nr:PKD domain-containing protein [Betaproteobacteria bacterium]